MKEAGEIDFWCLDKPFTDIGEVRAKHEFNINYSYATRRRTGMSEKATFEKIILDTCARTGVSITVFSKLQMKSEFAERLSGIDTKYFTAVRNDSERSTTR